MPAEELSAKAACARPVADLASVPRHLICAACRGLLINCFQTHSGFRLCQECVRSKLHPTNPTQCPGSCDQDDEAERMTSQATCLQDLATRLELSQLWVHCPNAEAGCEAQMIWKHVMQHLDEDCEKEVAKCPQCSQEVVLYKLRSSHRDLRSGECCPLYFSMRCPLCQDSSRSLDPSAFAEHEKTCPAKEAACKYTCVGCWRIMQRSQLSQHYSDSVDEHLEQTVRQLTDALRQKDLRIGVLQSHLEKNDRQIKEQHELIVKLQESVGSNHMTSVEQKDQRIKERLDLIMITKKLQARLDDIERRMTPVHSNRMDQSSQVNPASFDAMEARMTPMEANVSDSHFEPKSPDGVSDSHFQPKSPDGERLSMRRASALDHLSRPSQTDVTQRQHKLGTPGLRFFETSKRRNSSSWGLVNEDLAARERATTAVDLYASAADERKCNRNLDQSTQPGIRRLGRHQRSVSSGQFHLMRSNTNCSPGTERVRLRPTSETPGRLDSAARHRSSPDAQLLALKQQRVESPVRVSDHASRNPVSNDFNLQISATVSEEPEISLLGVFTGFVFLTGSVLMLVHGGIE